MSRQETKTLSVRTLDPATVDTNADDASGKRHLVPQNGDCQLSIEGKVGEQTEETRRTFLEAMDAIAYGVEARYELITGHSRRVAEETVAIARELGVPEDEIERWAALRLARLIRDTEKLREIKSRLERL